MIILIEHTLFQNSSQNTLIEQSVMLFKYIPSSSVSTDMYIFNFAGTNFLPIPATEKPIQKIGSKKVKINCVGGKLFNV